VEFGRKVLLGETDKVIVITCRVFEGNPADSTLFCLGVKGYRRLCRKGLRAVTADRGFQSRENREWLKGQLVDRIAMPFRSRGSKEGGSIKGNPGTGGFCASGTAARAE